MCCRELLLEKKTGAGSRWSKSKEALSGDARYKALPRDSREALFRQFVAEQEVDAQSFPAKASLGSICQLLFVVMDPGILKSTQTHTLQLFCLQEYKVCFQRQLLRVRAARSNIKDWGYCSILSIIRKPMNGHLC